MRTSSQFGFCANALQVSAPPPTASHHRPSGVSWQTSPSLMPPQSITRRAAMQFSGAPSNNGVAPTSISGVTSSSSAPNAVASVHRNSTLTVWIGAPAIAPASSVSCTVQPFASVGSSVTVSATFRPVLICAVKPSRVVMPSPTSPARLTAWLTEVSSTTGAASDRRAVLGTVTVPGVSSANAVHCHSGLQNASPAASQSPSSTITVLNSGGMVTSHSRSTSGRPAGGVLQSARVVSKRATQLLPSAGSCRLATPTSAISLATVQR